MRRVLKKPLLTMSAILLLPLLLAGSDPVNRWQDEADTLTGILFEEEVTGRDRMDALMNLAWIIRSSDPRQALEYSLEALDMARLDDDRESEARLMANIGHLHWRLGDYHQSFDYLLQSRQLYESLGHTMGYARTLNHLGILFSGQGHYDNALEYYLMALGIYEDLDSVARIASVLNNIGIVYENQHDYERAIEYHRRAMDISDQLDNEQGIAFSLHNMGSVMLKQGDYEGAMASYEAALAIRQKNPDKRPMAYTQRSIGYLNHKKGLNELALEQLLETEKLFRELGDDRALAQILHDLGQVSMVLDQTEASARYFYESLQIARGAGLLTIISDNYLSLSELLAAQVRFDSAYVYQRRHMNIRDSMYDEEARRRIIELELLYDRERKEAEIDLLRKANRIKELDLEKESLLRNLLLVFAFLVLILFFFLFYRFYELRRINKQLSKQKEEISQYNKELITQKQKVEALNARLRESEQHLMNANKTKDKFFSIISHDLRSPFASIVSFSRILKRDIEHLSKAELQELVRQLDLTVVKINGLLENLLQWSRAQSGKIPYAPEYFLVGDLLTEVLDLFAGTARDKEIELVKELPGDLVAWGDVNMTHTVARNLLSNAVKFTHPGGQVVVSATALEGKVNISVRDNGVGMSEEEMEKIFRQDILHSTHGTQDEKGSGLGLIICSEFVKKQGGDIDIKSQQGKGTEISFTIPSAPGNK